MTDPAGIPALQDAIRHLHGCESRHVETVHVHEKHEGKTVWGIPPGGRGERSHSRLGEGGSGRRSPGRDDGEAPAAAELSERSESMRSEASE